MELIENTEQLKTYLDTLKQKFEENNPPEDRRDKQFFLRVKEYTEPIYLLLEEWEADVLNLVKERVINLHPHQVTSTKENIELLLMHSFYVDVKRKRYMEIYNSVHFILDELLNDLAK